MIRTADTHTLQSGAASLDVEHYPLKGAPTVILLHGGPGVPDEMTEIREFLSAKFRVITFDQRGTGDGNSKDLTFTIPDYIQDINTIADFFQLEEFHLLGHSWGGLYAQLYAHEFPFKVLSLFLCSPAPGTGTIWDMMEKEIFKYNYRRSTKAEWIEMGVNLALGMAGSRAAYRRLFRQMIINYNKGYNVPTPDPEKLEKINARAGTLTRIAIKKYSQPEVIGKTPHPVMITYGEFDAYGKSREYVFKRYPYADVRIIPGSGHTPWKHNLPDFQKVLSSFYFPQITQINAEKPES